MPAVFSTAAAEAQSAVDVAIIGAGAAGIGAAREAKRRGLSYALIEARGRIGGRVFTDHSLGVPIDLGATYVHNAGQNPFTPVAQEKGIALSEQGLWHGVPVRNFRAGVPIAEGGGTGRIEARRKLHDLVENRSSRRDQSFADLVREAGPEVREVAASMTVQALGEDMARVSVQDWEGLESGDDRAVPAGFGTLLSAAAEGLDVTFDAPVTRIDFSGSAVRVETARGTLTARAVIVTVSIGVLKAGGIAFTPALPAEISAAIEGLTMGTLSKLVLKIEGERFGLSPGTRLNDSGAAGDVVAFEMWPWNRDIAVAWFGGDHARRLIEAGEAAAADVMIARLAGLLGASLVAKVSGVRLGGWWTDPYARGSYVVAQPGRAPLRAALSQPVAHKLWFAGEANAGALAMTAGGAALTAAQAVGQIAQVIGRG